MGLRLLLSEDISPHKISLLFLIGIHCTGNIPANEMKVVLNTVMKLLENEPLINEDGDIVVIPGILDLLRAIGGTKTPMLLLSSLWRINSVESLESSISAMQSLLSLSNIVVKKDNLRENDESSGTIKILPGSFFGLFIQKIVTTCSLLHFDESLLLYEAFLSYREASYDSFVNLGGDIEIERARLASELVTEGNQSGRDSMKGRDTQSDFELYAKLDNQLQREGLPIQLSLYESRAGKDKTVPKSHIDHSLLPVPKHDLQILLDKQIQLLESNGTPTPRILREIMTLMTSPTSNTCLIQNADFNNLPSYYYIQYLEALKDSDYNGAFASLHQYFDYMVSNNSKYFYHFALISRASLHQHFGEDEKALNAIEEAVSVARENRDNSTLTYILSWLYNFMKNKPNLWYKQTFNNEQHLLEFLVNKSHSVSLPLYAMSYQFETLHIMNSGEGNISRYIESLIKATYISIHDQLPTSFMKSIELATTVWFRIGNNNLANVYADIPNYIQDKSENPINLSDNVAIEIRKAYLSYHQGNVDLAYQKLEALKKRVGRNRLLGQSIQIRSLILLIKINLKRGRPYIAEGIMQSLINTEIQEQELAIELIYSYTEVQIELGNYSKALSYLTESLSKLSATANNECIMIIRLSYLKCRIFVQSGAHTRALSLVLQEIQRSKRIGMLSLVVEGAILLVCILNKMGTFSDAYSVLMSVMPNIRMVQNEDNISAAYYEFAYTCLKLLQLNKQKQQDYLDSKTLLGKVLRFLNISIDGYRKSLNLIMLQKCFELELEMARFKKLDELEAHARNSLEKLRVRLEEEVSYGFIQEEVSNEVVMQA